MQKDAVSSSTTLAGLPKAYKSWLIALCSLIMLALLAVVAFGQIHRPTPTFCQTIKQPFAYTLCQFDANNTHSQLQLAWRYPNSSTALLNFTNLKQVLSSSQRRLLFAMNAGMYDDKFAPIGYTVINGQTIHSLNLKQGGGNFHLMPNGVFWWDKSGYHITESQNMADKLAKGAKPLFATQSGPMLVINGQIHPSFDANSYSQKLRNGVGVCRDGKVKFVISDVRVNFYQFADIFKSQLQCDNALFLDGGTASALYSQELNRSDNTYMGVMLAYTVAD